MKVRIIIFFFLLNNQRILESFKSQNSTSWFPGDWLTTTNLYSFLELRVTYILWLVKGSLIYSFMLLKYHKTVVNIKLCLLWSRMFDYYSLIIQRTSYNIIVFIIGCWILCINDDGICYSPFVTLKLFYYFFIGELPIFFVVVEVPYFHCFITPSIIFDNKNIRSNHN